MPFMDGFKTTELIRQHVYNSGLPQPIIVAITGLTEDSHVTEAINSGMNQVLSKPVSGQVLGRIINQVGFPMDSLQTSLSML